MCFKIFGKVQVRNQMFLSRMKLNYGLYYRDEGKKSNVALNFSQSFCLKPQGHADFFEWEASALLLV